MKKRLISFLLVLVLVISVCPVALADGVNAISAGFTDISASAYYYDAVQWAVEQGVTAGTTSSTFSPETPCTRAQAVTFLWRAVGEPEPETDVNPFTDVSESAYYYKAVLWAVEKGITTGTSETTFSPDAPCTRAQIVTFLWRLAGGKAVDAANPFTDVAADAYYVGSVLWAVEEAVTTGTTRTTFSPDAVCTRAQIVTFLYRYVVGEPAAEEETETTPSSGNPTTPAPAPSRLRLVYGDEDLPDEDALALLIMGDGFTASQQKKFYSAAADTAAYIMSCAPFDEFADTIKIYALGVVSNVSGSQENANAEPLDTAFGSTFWYYGTERLIGISEEGEAYGYELRNEYLPEADYCLYLVNSEKYGGSGGDYCIASLNEQSLDIMVHEMGHTIADLADEYYAAGYEWEYANLTAYPEDLPLAWEKFIGKNGIGVYGWGGYRSTGYYIPSLYCKMQYLQDEDGNSYDFCEVCQEALRQAICADSNVTKLFFQPYNAQFVAGNVPDLSQYFILRRNGDEVTNEGNALNLTLTYYDEAGNQLGAAPSAAGTYSVKADYDGGVIDGVEYGACTVTAEYTIESIAIFLNVESKDYDGQPADFDLRVTYGADLDEGDYVVDVEYYGYQYYYGDSDGYYYDTYTYYLYDGSPLDGNDRYTVVSSDYASGEYEYSYYVKGGPTEPSIYTMTVSVYAADDKDYENPIATTTADYKIDFATTDIANNNDPDYYGAQSYGNNQTVLIFGEGYTADDQAEFEKDAADLVKGILEVEPIKETQLYFSFIAVNSISEESGVTRTTDEAAKDTFFNLVYDAEGNVVAETAELAQEIVTNLAYYDLDPYYSASIILVNDDVQDDYEFDTYAGYDGYEYYPTIIVNADSVDYVVTNLLRYLTGYELTDYEKDPNYKAYKEGQRLDLIMALYYDDMSPVIVSKGVTVSYGEDYAEDLLNSFEVYCGYTVDEYGYYYPVDIAQDPNKNTLAYLELTYWTADAEGNLTNVPAPSTPGTYYVKAETVINDDYWKYYTILDDGTYLCPSRGWTVLTITAADQ